MSRIVKYVSALTMYMFVTKNLVKPKKSQEYQHNPLTSVKQTKILNEDR